VSAHGFLLIRLDAQIARGPGCAKQDKFLCGIHVEKADRSGLIHFSREQTAGAGDTPSSQAAVRQIEAAIKSRFQDELRRAARKRYFRAARNESDLKPSLRVSQIRFRVLARLVETNYGL
jgi:hypothetical protein